MGLLRERLKRASKNRVVPVATVQPTIKQVAPPVQQVPQTNEIVDDDYNSADEEQNSTFTLPCEPNQNQSPLRYSSNSPLRSGNSVSYRSGNIATADNTSSLRMGFG